MTKPELYVADPQFEVALVACECGGAQSLCRLVLEEANHCLRELQARRSTVHLKIFLFARFQEPKTAGLPLIRVARRSRVPSR